MAGSKKYSQDDEDFRRRLRELHRHMVRGDAAAFEEVVGILRPRLVVDLAQRFGRRVDEQDTEECVDEVLLNYRDKPSEFRPTTRVSLHAFLELAAKRRILNRLRGEKRRKARDATFIKEKINPAKGEWH